MTTSTKIRTKRERNREIKRDKERMNKAFFRMNGKKQSSF